MADNGVNKGRRRFLVGATTVVGGVGAVGVAVPFVASWQPSARARAAGAPVKADVSKLEPGQRMVVEWRGKPVWVVYRTPEMVERTEGFDASRLADPDSEVPQQPAYVTGPLRAIKPELGVYIGICTHLGCSPLFRPEPDADDVGTDDWPGGYFCPCHGSRFDLAGRVFRGVPAPTNLEVPPYRFESDDIIVVGEDEETA
ncbi:ubiquinol-cytochrome c reductase iron-sulfur subunit [Halomonas alimentaria]|uniref:Ubiquinol-cytochrome c reductase iron-sulfur subunit n=1 Tax=Halomonas alimentaria TaxID=147248 RepID=A0A7X4W697_9GAMM|nr:ubiquinol-cytochrome c reductase iron-sulfur subunit [Halomonas alimentaria]NAW35167.1 ubiquinol-cytochrome c reductase iron-sulfur subunit [Halomonas alimentaria]